MDQGKTTPVANPEPNPKLFVNGLAWAATDDDLREAFKDCGEIVSATVVRYADTGRSKGFGFVEFTSTEEATKGLELDGTEILGRAVKVDYAFNNKQREDKAE